VDLGYARVTKRGRAAVVEFCNQRHLNAEDDATIGPTESAVDLVLLDPETEVGVLRGAVVDHARYGREWTAGDADAHLIVDEVIEAGEMDAALEARVDLLTGSGLISAAANRCALRVGQEPLDVFREYMATYAREQANCHLSPTLVANLERHWDAANRRA
jgi:enoyl-CoA hydratase/carnithine racemase